MSVFPVTASTISADQLGLFIKKQYGLNDDYTCRLFRTGMNHTYFLANKETTYVVRVYSYKWRTRLEIEEEINLLNELKENQVSVSYPVLDKKGVYIQDIPAPEGERYAVLFSFAEGGKIRFMDKETCFSIGSLLAKIHATTINKHIDRVVYAKEVLVELPYSYAKQFFSETLEEMQFIKEAGYKISQALDEADINTIQKGIVHLDIWYDNMSVANQNEITVFDFDFCGNGWLIFDVAYFCKQLFHIETDKEEYERKVQRFLSGYQQTGKLSEAEIKLIPYAAAAIFIFYLGVQSQRFDWSNIFLTENYLKMYVGRIKSWLTYYETKRITDVG